MIRDDPGILTQVFSLYEPSSAFKKKSKVILLHAMEAHGGRGGIVPTPT
jgi:hypothetical protein